MKGLRKIIFLRERDELDVFVDLIDIQPFEKISYTWNIPEDESILINHLL